MKTVLYSCIGTTDPVRGMRDGGLMHIMRFYRPDTVYLFLTGEIARLDKGDGRIDKTFSHIKEKWDGYAPRVVRCKANIEDPSDMDTLSEPMDELLQTALRENPGAQVLLNLSSGTPQMQIILAQMALDPRYATRGIQVKNPERQSGTAERTNTKRYTVDEALELNKDDEPGAPNRCCEPKMMAVRKEAVRNQLVGLVSQRNYAAIAQMGAQLPAPIPQLAKHLDYRSRFLLEEAREAAKELERSGLADDLELLANDDNLPRMVYRITEYFGVLKHLVYLKRYTDFVLRLNPFLILLQLAMLEKELQKIGMYIDPVIKLEGSHKKINPDGIRENVPEMLTFLEKKFGREVQERDVSIFILNGMLEYLKADESTLKLLKDCEKLNKQLRNIIAHTLFSVSDKDIQSICGHSAEDLIDSLEKVLLTVLGNFKPEKLKKRLTVYERCDAYIMKCL